MIGFILKITEKPSFSWKKAETSKKDSTQERHANFSLPTRNLLKYFNKEKGYLKPAIVNSKNRYVAK